MDKKHKRLIKHFLALVCTWTLARLVISWLVGLMYTLDQGWLIKFLLMLIDEVVPPVLAFAALWLQYYADAKEDGELDQLLGRKPVMNHEVLTSEQVDVTIHKECQPYSAPEPPIMSAPPSVSGEPTVEVAEPATEPVAKPSTEPATKLNDENVAESITEPTAPDEVSYADNTASDIPAENAIPAAAVTDTTTEDDDIQPADPFECIRDSKIMAHYIVLDIETTGFSHDNDRVIEIAAIHYVFGVEAERFHTYINPQMPIPKHITRLTGIRQADVDAAPLLDDIADDFRAFIKDYPLVGHNIIDFDLPFLASHMNLDESRIVIDTLDMSRFAFPMLPSHKLSNLNYWFDLDDGTSHHADADASAANALMWACLYPDKYEGLYRKAIRDGLPESKHTHEPKPHHHFHHISTSEIKPASSHDTTPGPLAGKKIVFTGDLSIPRKEAMQMAVDAGAILRSSVSCKTDFLIVGEQDLTVVGSDGMSTKQEKANELNSLGKANIQIINEQEFLTMIEQQTATV